MQLRSVERIWAGFFINEVAAISSSEKRLNSGTPFPLQKAFQRPNIQGTLNFL